MIEELSVVSPKTFSHDRLIARQLHLHTLTLAGKFSREIVSFDQFTLPSMRVLRMANLETESWESFLASMPTAFPNLTHLSISGKSFQKRTLPSPK